MQDPDDDIVVDAQPESWGVLDSRQEIGSEETPTHKISSSENKTEAKRIPNLTAKNVDWCQEKENEANTSKPQSENTTVKTPSLPERKRLLFYKDKEYFSLFHFLPHSCSQDHLHEENFDILIINVEEDEDDAKDFKNHLEKSINLDFHGETFYPRVHLLEEMRDGSNEPLDLAFLKTCFVFIYVTEALCKNPKAVFKGNACLQEALEDETKKKTIIPIYTIQKQYLKLPMMLKSLRGIDYWRGKENPDYVESVRKLIQDKMSYLFKRDSELSRSRSEVIESNRKEIFEARDFFYKQKRYHEKTSLPITKMVPNEVTLPSVHSSTDCFDTSDSTTTFCNSNSDGEVSSSENLSTLVSQMQIPEHEINKPENSDGANVLSSSNSSSQTFKKTVTNVCVVAPQTNTNLNAVSQTPTFDNSVSFEQCKEGTARASNELIGAGTCHPASSTHVYEDSQTRYANPVCYSSPLHQSISQQSQALLQFYYFNNLYAQQGYALRYGPEAFVPAQPDIRSQYASPSIRSLRPVQPESAVFRQPVFIDAHTNMAHEPQFQRSTHSIQSSHIHPGIQQSISDSNIRMPIPDQPGTSGLNQHRDNSLPSPAQGSERY